jgi:hypothetical protein
VLDGTLGLCGRLLGFLQAHFPNNNDGKQSFDITKVLFIHQMMHL